MSWQPLRFLAGCLVAAIVALGPAPAVARPTAATPAAPGAVVGAAPADVPVPACPVGGVEVDLAGSDDTAVVSGHAGSACGAGARAGRGGGGPRAFFTYEITCSTDRARAAQGLCASTPCNGGRFFAFRTLHLPGGRTRPAGSSCVSLNRAPVARALTAAEVLAAVRRVRLPGGAIHLAPSGRGLANAPSRLWLGGDAQPPVNLRLAGSTVHAEFQPVRYRWTIGPGRTVGAWTAAEAGGSGRDGEAQVTFPGRGNFVVTVVTTWSASAFLDGRFVGQVQDLSSTARTTYAVAELRTALSG